MLKEISLEDLIRLDKCIESHFGQFYKNGILIVGEVDEENKRLMDLYGKIMWYYHDNPDFDGIEINNKFINSQDMTIHHIKREIKSRQEIG